MCELCDRKPPRLTRRRLLTGAAFFAAAGMLSLDTARAAPAKPAQNAIPPSEALDLLKQGNARYAANEAAEADYSASGIAGLKGAYPIAAVLSCADSPVPPETVFDQRPGNIFAVRNAGNVITGTSLASFEYAVEIAGVPLLLVLGHSGCNVVAEALAVTRFRKELPGELGVLMKTIEPAVIAAHGRHPSDFLAATIEENVRLSVKRLMKDSEILSEAVAAKKIAVSGGIHDLATGEVTLI